MYPVPAKKNNAMQVVPDLPDDMWYLILEGVDDDVSALTLRCVSRLFTEALCDTFDALRFLRKIREEYQPRCRARMERMGLLSYTRQKHTCTEREKHLLSAMLRRCSDVCFTAYTRNDFFVIDLTERSILTKLIMILWWRFNAEFVMAPVDTIALVGVVTRVIIAPPTFGCTLAGA